MSIEEPLPERSLTNKEPETEDFASWRIVPDGTNGMTRGDAIRHSHMEMAGVVADMREAPDGTLWVWVETKNAPGNVLHFHSRIEHLMPLPQPASPSVEITEDMRMAVTASAIPL